VGGARASVRGLAEASVRPHPLKRHVRHRGQGRSAAEKRLTKPVVRRFAIGILKLRSKGSGSAW